MLKPPTIDELEDFTLESYVKLLKYLSQIYKIVPFSGIPREGTPYLILRHDIDISLPAALKMAQIERDLGVKSTYFVLFSSEFYNVLEADNVDILRQVLKLGHEIGLHYHPAQYRLYNQKPKKTLEIEIELLEHLVGRKIYGIARHGPWDRDPFAGIKKYINANHPYLRGDLFVHESGRAWSPLHGLVNLLNNPPKRVQLLTHPENWQEDKIDRITLLERHFQDLKKRNSLLKKRFLEYIQTDELVVSYDNMIRKDEPERSHILEYRDTKKNKLRQALDHYDTLFRHYIVNTSLGWNAHQLKTRIQNKFQKFKKSPALTRKEPEISTSDFSTLSIKPLIIISAYYSSISGGYRRVYEVLKNGRLEGVDYVIVTDQISHKNYTKMFPDFKEIFHQYKSYIISPQKIRFLTPLINCFSKTATTYMNFLSLASSISKIALEEDVDLIVGSSEGYQHVWTSYLSGKICNKPWTFVFHGQKDILQPTPRLGPLNLFNVLNHVNQKASQRKTALISKIGSSLGLLVFLKLAEKSLILTVSPSVTEETRFLNPRIEFRVIAPGNGVDLKKFDKERITAPLYDAVFFSRLLPEKGLLDIPEIGKLLVQQLPKARIAVAGISENPEFVEDFRRMIFQYDLTRNIVFLGQQDQDSIIDLVRSSKLTIYPSVSDTYGLVVLESLACGRPVVAYDIPAIRHNFGNVKAVLRGPVEDKMAMVKNIQFLLENEDFRTRISKEAKEHVSKYDWRNVVRAEKEAYFKVIEWFNS